MMTRFYYLLCFSFSQTISTVFWRLCLPSGFQQLSWCTSTSGSFCLLYMCAIAFYVLSVFMCEFPPRVYMEAVKLESMHAPEHVMSSLVVAQVLIYKYIMVKCVVVIVCHKKSSLFQFGQFSDLSHGVSNTF